MTSEKKEKPKSRPPSLSRRRARVRRARRVQRALTVAMTAIVALAFWQHRSNIGRLMNHCENKTYLFRKK